LPSPFGGTDIPVPNLFHSLLLYQWGAAPIISTYKRQGYGQMAMALDLIGQLKPKKIIVSTGMTLIFLPARRMYESVGFVKQRVCKQDHLIVPWTIEYCIDRQNALPHLGQY
jgi:hypothetical protein